jgi:hypothetical protein
MINPFSVQRVLKSRLNRKITQVENEIKAFELKIDQPPALNNAKQILNLTKEDAKNNKLDDGWSKIHLSEQFLVRSMTNDQVQIKANMLRIEVSDKIPGWRNKQIKFLFNTKEGGEKRDITTEELLEAMKAYADYYDTRNNKLAIHQASVKSLTLYLISLIIIAFVSSFFINILQPANFTQKMFFAALFGSIGACFSIANSFFSFKFEAKIPQQLQSFTVTTIRIIIGITSAIIIFMLLSNGFLKNIFSADMLNSPAAYILLSFFAGYSERWVIGLFGNLMKENVEKTDK